jgi:predicted porin
VKIIIPAIVLFIFTESHGQDTLNHLNVYPGGISIEYGIGSYSVKDEYISKEKYSGSLPYYSFGWARKHNKYVYRLEMAYRNSNSIKNYNVSTSITQVTLNQGFLYPLKKKLLFKKELYIWLGPSTEFFFYYAKPHIAVSGFDYAQSFAGLFSLGFNADIVYSLNQSFQLESSLRSTVLSLGWRMVDSEEDDQSPVKPLTLFSGLNCSFNLGARYYIFNRLSVIITYKFELTHISAWDPLISTSNNAIIGLTYRF